MRGNGVSRRRRRVLAPRRRLEGEQGNGSSAAHGKAREDPALLPPPACDDLRPVPDLERSEHTDPHPAILRAAGAQASDERDH